MQKEHELTCTNCVQIGRTYAHAITHTHAHIFQAKMNLLFRCFHHQLQLCCTDFSGSVVNHYCGLLFRVQQLSQLNPTMCVLFPGNLRFNGIFNDVVLRFPRYSLIYIRTRSGFYSDSPCFTYLFHQTSNFLYGNYN